MAQKLLKVRKAVEQFKRDGEFAPLAAYLPKELAAVPRPQLRVCEAAVQLTYLEIAHDVQVSQMVEDWLRDRSRS